MTVIELKHARVALALHGHSGHVRGGGYTPEFWVADADIALEALGDDALVVGAGISAYIALQLAGARPEAVRGAVLLPGAGLDGGGVEPDWSRLPLPLTASGESAALRTRPALDRAVWFANEVVRPAWYVQPMAAAARCLVLLDDGGPRGEWWHALIGLPRVHVHSGAAASALAYLAAEVGLAPQLPSTRQRADGSAVAGRAQRS